MEVVQHFADKRDLPVGLVILETLQKVYRNGGGKPFTISKSAPESAEPAAEMFCLSYRCFVRFHLLDNPVAEVGNLGEYLHFLCQIYRVLLWQGIQRLGDVGQHVEELPASTVGQHSLAGVCICVLLVFLQQRSFSCVSEAPPFELLSKSRGSKVRWTNQNSFLVATTTGQSAFLVDEGAWSKYLVNNSRQSSRWSTWATLVQPGGRVPARQALKLTSMSTSWGRNC